MQIIIWIVLGYIIGWMAPDMIKTSTNESMVFYLILGIIGAVFGGSVTDLIISNFTFFNLITAVFGAFIFIRLGRHLGRI